MSKVNGSFAVRPDIKKMLKYLADDKKKTMSEIIEILVEAEMRDVIGNTVQSEPQCTYSKRTSAKINELLLDENINDGYAKKMNW